MSWGVTTQKGNKIYLHILKWEKVPLSIPYVENIVQVNIWPSQSQVVVTQEENSLILHLSEDDIDEIDTIIELELAGSEGSDLRG